MADQTLASLTAATSATGGLIYGTQGGADRKFTLTAVGASLVEATTAADQRAALELGELATIAPGSGVTTWLSTPSLANLNSALASSVAPIASPTFTGIATAPAVTVSGGQITSTQVASSTTASLDFYANTGEPSWPSNDDKWFTWSATVNGTKTEIMKLYAIDATTWSLRGNFGIYPNTMGPSIPNGTTTFQNGTFLLVQSLIQLAQYGPNPDITKWDASYPLLMTATNHSYQFGNSTSSQKISAINTWTDNTHFEAAVIDWQTTANTLRMGSDVGSGGGTARDVQFIRGGTPKITVGENTTDHAQPVKLPSFSVSGLPDAATCGLGALAMVSDATSTTAYSTVSGGGSSKVLVVSDGTNWIIH